MQFAKMVAGLAGYGSHDRRNPPPVGELESEENMRMVPIPPRADPKSKEFDGSLCFRSRNPGLAFFLDVKRPRQVGDDVIPGEFRNMRFVPVGSYYGELFVDKDDPDFAKIKLRVRGGVDTDGLLGAKGRTIKPHDYYSKGVFVDAVASLAETKKLIAKELIAALADADVKAEVEAELGSEVVSTFMEKAAGVVKPTAADKAKTRPRGN